MGRFVNPYTRCPSPIDNTVVFSHGTSQPQFYTPPPFDVHHYPHIHFNPTYHMSSHPQPGMSRQHFPPQASHFPMQQAAISDGSRSSFQSQPRFSMSTEPYKAQGNLVYSSQAIPLSPVVVISKKFAGTCQRAFPLTLTNSAWYLNSGATDHVVGDSHSLLQQIEYKGANKLMVGNGQNLDITHVGNTYLPTCFFDIKLLNVLVVPHIAKNLLSVSQLTRDNNLTIEFNAICCVLKDSQKTPFLKG